MPKGERDRFGIAREGCAKCAAHASDPRGGGVVILFYAYVRVSDPDALAARLRAACDAAGVTGKIRVAAEGINGTAAGPAEGVDALIAALESDTNEPEMASACGRMDWKRQRGCAHLFDDASVRVVPEIVPFEDARRVLGAETSSTSVATRPVAPVERLDPLAFHAEAARATLNSVSEGSEGSDVVLLDVRNWYESRLGFFEGAVRAPIRRFSQLREWLDLDPFRFKGKRVLAYCTGGVRCEKACAYLASLDATRRPRSVAQLSGGVAAYARDVVGCEEARIDATTPHKEAGGSLFLGSNFVFDARGATRVTDDVRGWCDGCGGRTDRVTRARARGATRCCSCVRRARSDIDRPKRQRKRRRRRRTRPFQKKKKAEKSSAAFPARRKTPSVAAHGARNAKNVGRATATGTRRGNDVCCPKSPPKVASRA